ncbi:hypothetical protein [Occallatibacter riparius]|uniref:Uncharacterized protein n=1 Tax=Occallatibacter riparius TaxID=1002689 RepID=A0A9J7BIX2_9BACT|nr:hypothetical protein [Occallatibacter riparius]UWZ82760.1 hypothetical protein MOP44_19575 [Occallatibacter riparius]
MNLDRDQLEALKRQIEEEYKLDIAAIERLQRRVGLGSSSSNGRSLGSTPAVSAATPSYLAPVVEAAPAPAAPVVELPQERQPDELTGTLRAMFSGQRK